MMPGGPRHFVTTRWSLVLAANEDSAQALSELCRIYYYPVYGHVRRRGYGAEEGLELTQEFFARHVLGGKLSHADPDRGRFRSWLLGAVSNFLKNHWDFVTAAKRDFRRVDWLSSEDLESRYARESHEHTTPETHYHRRWAFTVLERGLALLRSENEAPGKREFYDAVERFLVGQEGDHSSYVSVAEALDLTTGTVEVKVSHLRKRFRVLLRQVVADTVGDPEEVDDEIAFLIRAVSTEPD